MSVQSQLIDALIKAAAKRLLGHVDDVALLADTLKAKAAMHMKEGFEEDFLEPIYKALQHDEEFARLLDVDLSFTTPHEYEQDNAMVAERNKDKKFKPSYIIYQLPETIIFIEFNKEPNLIQEISMLAIDATQALETSAPAR